MDEITLCGLQDELKKTKLTAIFVKLEIWFYKYPNYICIQSNLSNVTFQGHSEMWSHKTGGRLIHV